MTILSGQSVRQIVVEHPDSITVLEQHGLDCYSGNVDTLARVCAKRDLDPKLLPETLPRRQENVSIVEFKRLNVPLKDIVAYLVKRHHALARRHRLDLMHRLATRVERQHGNKHPELFQLSAAVAAISTELEFHFFWEERILFPYISQLCMGHTPESPPACVCRNEPFDHVLTDHEHTRNELCLLRELTNNYLPPTDACTSCRTLYRALEGFEKGLLEHIDLVNCLLFSRVLNTSSASL